jgi:hypothetical protein
VQAEAGHFLSLDALAPPSQRGAFLMRSRGRVFPDRIDQGSRPAAPMSKTQRSSSIVLQLHQSRYPVGLLIDGAVRAEAAGHFGPGSLWPKRIPRAVKWPRSLATLVRVVLGMARLVFLMVRCVKSRSALEQGPGGALRSMCPLLEFRQFGLTMDTNPRVNFLELVMLAVVACVFGWFAWAIGHLMFAWIFAALTFASLMLARRL